MPMVQVASFDVSHLQILDENGTVDKELEPDLGDSELRSLYRAMALGRAADERMLKLQRQGRIGTFAPSTGQEAAMCGSAFALRDDDWVVPTYREQPVRLMRGEPFEKTLLYYNGYEEGSPLPIGARTLPVQVILGSQLLHAVGLAYAMQYKGEEGTAVLTYFGDGASSQGDFHEAANFAGVWKAPVVFFNQNNGWAISVPREAQTASQTIAQKAISYGFPGIQVDGNDVLAVYKATKDALARARAGDGPTLIEAVTYRLMMHTTADDPKKYRDRDEEKLWWDKDPIPRFRSYLEQKGLWSEKQESEMKAEITEEISAAVKRFEASTDFKPDAPFDHVFGTRHEAIEDQRAEFLRELRLEGHGA